MRCARGRIRAQGDEFLERFQELLLLERGGFPKAIRSECPRGAGRCAAAADLAARFKRLQRRLAAAVGIGFAFAHHFADYDAASAMLSYREHFKPSATMAEPYAILARR